MQERRAPAAFRAEAEPAMFDYLVVGAGFAGSVLAERLASGSDCRVLICDKRPHIGGNAYDHYNEHGILVHKYGPHIFHTNSLEVFEYLSRFTEWRPYEHRVLASVDGMHLPIPINLDTINRLYGLKLTSFEFEQFLDSSVIARVPVRTNRDDRYFGDTYQAMPLHGYTRMFENMLDHRNIKILLNTDYREIQDEIPYREMIYTGPIDEFFDYQFGKLPYRSLEFKHETKEMEVYQDAPVVNYPNTHAYTRVTEFKYLTGQKHPKTSIVFEFPRSEGDPYYPVPRAQNAELYAQYKELADAEPNVHFVGRLATYKYYNMDQITAQALSTYAKISGNKHRAESTVRIARPRLSPKSSFTKTTTTTLTTP